MSSVNSRSVRDLSEKCKKICLAVVDVDVCKVQYRVFHVQGKAAVKVEGKPLHRAWN